MKFGTSGIRGIYGEDITEEKVMAFFSEHSPGHMVVSHDARPASLSLKHSAISALLRNGSSVVDIGMVPTGINSFISRELRSFGVQFTASHNPPEYAGMKFFSKAGRGMRSAPGHEKGTGGSYRSLDPRPAYFRKADRFLRIFKPSARVLLDPGNGSASGFFDHYFLSRGIRFDSINNFPSALNPNRGLEPKPETIGEPIRYLKSSDCEIGAAFDGDADRVVFFDKEGFLGFNEMISIIAREYVERTGASRKVVTTIESGMMVDQILGGFRLIRTSVGDISVSEMMPEHGIVGIEQPGHYIFWDFYPAPDVLLPVLIASSIGPEEIRSRIDGMERTYFVKESIKAGDKHAMVERFRKRADEFDYLEKSEKDGIFLKGDDWLLLVRASGTEDVVRISADSYSKAKSKELIEMAKRIMEVAR